MVLSIPLPILHPPVLYRAGKTHPDTFPQIKEQFNRAAERGLRAQRLANFSMCLSLHWSSAWEEDGQLMLGFISKVWGSKQTRIIILLITELIRSHLNFALMICNVIKTKMQKWSYLHVWGIVFPRQHFWNIIEGLLNSRVSSRLSTCSNTRISSTATVYQLIPPIRISLFFFYCFNL